MKPLGSMLAIAAVAGACAAGVAAAVDQPPWGISLSVTPTAVQQGQMPTTITETGPRLFGTVTGPQGDTLAYVSGYESSTCTGERFFRLDGGRALGPGAFTRWLTQESPSSWQAGTYSFQGVVHNAADDVKARSACVLFTITPPPGQAPVKPVIGRPVTTPAKALAGRRFTVSFAVTRSDDGKPLTSGTMRCQPSVAGKVLPHLESFRGGTARLSFAIPRSARGKLLKVMVTITLDRQSATRTAGFHVTRAARAALGDRAAGA